MPRIPVFLVALAVALTGAAVARAETERARLTWSAPGADIDLHVFDDDGNHAWYADRAGVPGARLSSDVRRGPGQEALIDGREPSRRRLAYGVCYYAARGVVEPVAVTLVVADADGTRRTISETLQTPGATVLAGDGVGSHAGAGVGASVGAGARWGAGARASAGAGGSPGADRPWCDARVPDRAARAPRSVRAPSVRGLALVGRAVHCDLGAWDDGPRAFTVTWLRDGAPIGVGPEHLVTNADMGRGLSCRVAATTAAGRGTAESRRTVAVDVQTLATRFRPRLYFDRRERWRPLDVEALLHERRNGRPAHAICAVSEPWPQHPHRCAAGTGSAVAGPPSLRTHDRADAVLDLNADGGVTSARSAVSPTATCRAGGLADCDRGAAAAIYYRAIAAGDALVLDYWLYYRFNDAPYSSRTPRFLDNDHEGDWENVSVGVSPADADGTAFAWVAYAAHGRPARRYPRRALACDDDHRRGSCARAGARRPHVYVARGTHASYPQRCTDRGEPFPLPASYLLGCRQRDVEGAQALPEGGHDGRRAWGSNDDPRALHALRTGDGFTRWRGRWGLPGVTRSPGWQWNTHDTEVHA